MTTTVHATPATWHLHGGASGHSTTSAATRSAAKSTGAAPSRMKRQCVRPCGIPSVAKPVPPTVTVVPPAAGPLLGWMALISTS